MLQGIIKIKIVSNSDVGVQTHCAIALRYRWDPPSHCICGKLFSIEHALSCPFGGYPTLRHSEIQKIQNLTANLLSEVCHNVSIEPTLQPLTGETFHLASTITDNGTRSDIAANGFWRGHFEQTFFDVKELNPHAPSTCSTHMLHPHAPPTCSTHMLHPNALSKARK